MDVGAAERGKAIAWLIANQHGDGAWGIRSNGSAYVEPTALAMLALGRPGTDSTASASRAGRWLLATQRADGSWGTSPSTDARSWCNGYALLALVRTRSGLPPASVADALSRGTSSLLDRTTRRPSSAEAALVRQSLGIDGSLIGWPWHSDDSSWVFPTSIAMIAAVALGFADHQPVREGAAYLVDRACQNGGWNFGNPYMLGKAFTPNPIDTAVALLALKAVGMHNHPTALTGLRVIHELVAQTTSPLSLAWGLLGIRAYGQQSPTTVDLLARRQSEAGHWSGNVAATALSVLATDPQTPADWIA